MSGTGYERLHRKMSGTDDGLFRTDYIIQELKGLQSS